MLLAVPVLVEPYFAVTCSFGMSVTTPHYIQYGAVGD